MSSLKELLLSKAEEVGEIRAEIRDATLYKDRVWATSQVGRGAIR